MSRRIAVIVGSLREGSLNRQFAQALIKLAPATVEFQFIGIGELPLYNQDEDLVPSPSVTSFREEVKACQAVLFVTPEYNRSIPGVLKNALDQGSRPSKQSVWARIPAGIVGVSPGAIRTAAAQQHLRTILAHLDMPTLGQPEAFIHGTEDNFDEAGNLSEGVAKFMKRWIDAFLEFVEANQPK